MSSVWWCVKSVRYLERETDMHLWTSEVMALGCWEIPFSPPGKIIPISPLWSISSKIPKTPLRIGTFQNQKIEVEKTVWFFQVEKMGSPHISDHWKFQSGTLTEHGIYATLGTNKRNAWIWNRMKERSTYNTNDINYCQSHPLKIIVLLFFVNCCTFKMRTFTNLMFEFNK